MGLGISRCLPARFVGTADKLADRTGWQTFRQTWPRCGTATGGAKVIEPPRSQPVRKRVVDAGTSAQQTVPSMGSEQALHRNGYFRNAGGCSLTAALVATVTIG